MEPNHVGARNRIGFQQERPELLSTDPSMWLLHLGVDFCFVACFVLYLGFQDRHSLMKIILIIINSIFHAKQSIHESP